MKYTQINAQQVFAAISNGLDVIICDFNDSKIWHTNTLTVETIRNFIGLTGIAFFKAEEVSA